MLSVLHALPLLHFTNPWSSALCTSHTTIASLHQSVKQCSLYFTHYYCFTSPIREAVLSVLHTLLLLHLTNLWSSALRTSHATIASLHQSVKQCSPHFTCYHCFTSPIREAIKCFTVLSSCTVSLGPVGQSTLRIYICDAALNSPTHVYPITQTDAKTSPILWK